MIALKLLWQFQEVNWRSMNANEIQRNYIKLIYGKNKFIKNSSVFSDIEINRLEVEQKARIRNIRTILFNESFFIKSIYTKEEFLILVNKFVTSDFFWNFFGRTLMENFCLYIFNNSKESELKKLILKIEGITSALSNNKNIKSPWGNIRNDNKEKFIDDFNVNFEKNENGIYSFESEKKLTEYEIYRSSEGIKVKVVTL